MKHRALILLAAASLSGVAPAAEPTRYLAFQIFTGGEPGDPEDVARLRSIEDLRNTVVDLRDRIGTRGTRARELGVVLGPIAFDHTDEQVRRLIGGAFDIALETGVAVGFHIDDQMFWGRRLTELAAPRNVEWLDWQGTPNRGRRLDWSSKPLEIAPQLCLNSPAVRAAVVRRAALIGNEIAKGVAGLRTAHRDDLFIGVIAGWETQLGRDFETVKISRLLRAHQRGFQRGASARRHRCRENADRGRLRSPLGAVVDRCRRAARQGVFARRVHVGADVHARATRRSVATVGSLSPARQLFLRRPRPSVTRARLASRRTPNPDSSTSGRASERNMEIRTGHRRRERRSTRVRWSAAMGMERYLGNMFNHGAVLVNIFGWGVGDAANPFRRIAESQSAIAAYRRFLRGEQLAEASFPAPRMPPVGLAEKIHRVQAELPAWVRENGPARVQASAARLDRALRAERYAEASEAADAVLRTIERP